MPQVTPVPHVIRTGGTVGLASVKPHDFRRFVGTQLAKRDIYCPPCEADHH